MEKYKFDELSMGALFANVTTCHYDGLSCPYKEADDEICLVCLLEKIAEYRKYVKSLEDKFNGPAA